MLKAEEQMELVVLKKHGGSIRSLTRLTGRSRNTVRRYLRDGDALGHENVSQSGMRSLIPTKNISSNGWRLKRRR